jgi:hypothetical protein
LSRQPSSGEGLVVVSSSTFLPAEMLRWTAGDNATNTVPEQATTSGKPPKTHEDHNLRLEY